MPAIPPPNHRAAGPMLATYSTGTTQPQNRRDLPRSQHEPERDRRVGDLEHREHQRDHGDAVAEPGNGRAGKEVAEVAFGERADGTAKSHLLLLAHLPKGAKGSNTERIVAA